MIVPHSIFETNRFLSVYNPAIIEYAAFFGSIQILNYLRFNNVDLNSSLWTYVIHGGNYEMIHLLEENEIKPEKQLLYNFDKFYECFYEAVKCFHNEIAIYIVVII